MRCGYKVMKSVFLNDTVLLLRNHDLLFKLNGGKWILIKPKVSILLKLVLEKECQMTRKLHNCF